MKVRLSAADRFCQRRDRNKIRDIPFEITCKGSVGGTGRALYRPWQIIRVIKRYIKIKINILFLISIAYFFVVLKYHSVADVLIFYYNPFLIYTHIQNLSFIIIQIDLIYYSITYVAVTSNHLKTDIVHLYLYPCGISSFYTTESYTRVVRNCTRQHRLTWNHPWWYKTKPHNVKLCGWEGGFSNAKIILNLSRSDLSFENLLSNINIFLSRK